MEDDGIRYCILHERTVGLEENKEFHLREYFYDRAEVNPLASLDQMECYGPFAFCPPPPPLTEEEWKTILEQEPYHYAN